MVLIYRLIHNFILGFLCFLFYQKIINMQTKKTLLALSCSLAFAVLMLATYTFANPFSSAIGIIIFGIMIRIWQRSINWASLILAFVFGHVAWVIAILIAGAIVVPLGIQAPIDLALTLVIEVLAYIFFHKIIKLKNGIPSMEEKEIKSIVLAIAGIILVVLGGYHIAIGVIHEESALLFFFVMAILAFAVLILAILILYLSKKYRERMAVEQKLHETEVEFGKLVSRHHKYRDIVSAVDGSSRVMIKTTLEKGRADTEALNKYLGAIDKLAAEAGLEFAMDDVNDAVDTLMLPELWFPLANRLRQLLIQCEQKGITMFIKNIASDETWESLTVSKLDFIRIVGNLLSNAIKELDKSNPIGKQVMVDFLDEKGVFVFVVRDNAHEFSTDILARLGQRKNSTNGTGDGYAEIFEILNANNATFEMTERKENEKNRKIIRIIFDGKNQRIIRTDYRYEELKVALAATPFEIKQLA